MSRGMTLRALCGPLLGMALTLWAVPVLAESRVWISNVPASTAPAFSESALWDAVPEETLSSGVATDRCVAVREGAFAAVCRPVQGVVSLYAVSAEPEDEIARLAPFPFRVEGKTAAIHVSRRKSDPACVDLLISYPDLPEGPAVEFNVAHQIVTLKAVRSVSGVEVFGAFDHLLAPDFIADDLIYSPARIGGVDRMFVPAQNALVGFCRQRNAALVACWDGAVPETGAFIEHTSGRADAISGLRFLVEGSALHLGLIHQSACWHIEHVGESSYEKAVDTGWTPPFPAKWVTQLAFQNYAAGEWGNAPSYLAYDGTLDTVILWDGPRRTWRATVGWYEWPCWFETGTARLRLGSKVWPPSTDLVIYALERSENTPKEALLPLDMIQTALGTDRVNDLFGLPGRARHSLYRGADGVYNEPTCGTTENLIPFFERGEEAQNKELIRHVADDIMHYYERMMGRVDRFRAFAETGRRFLDDLRARDAQLALFAEEVGLPDTIQSLEAMCSSDSMVNLLTSGEGVLDELRALCEEHRPGNLDAYKRIRTQITHRGGMLDSCAARCDFWLRGLAQRAGYRCIDRPERAVLARELRAMVREYLKNPTQWEQNR